jgi:hypothetical protein
MSMLHSLACSVSASVWLHDQQLELADLRQDLIDEWIAAGLRMRRRVRLFLAWLRRAKVTGALDVDGDDRPAARPAIDDEQRSGFSGSCCTTRNSTSATVSAEACYCSTAKPITRIVALRTADIRATPSGTITLRLGRGEIPLPEPLAGIARALRERRLQRTETDGWLIPGRHAGQHLTADTLQKRLKRYGIERSREGRHAALLALAVRLPAPILAERIGIHQSWAAAWVRMAGGANADYVAVRNLY